MATRYIAVQEDDFDLTTQYQQVRTFGGSDAGAIASFIGLVRDHNKHAGDGGKVSSLTLEHYPGMTEQHLEDMRSEAVSKHGLEDALVVHRVGIVHPGDDIVLVAAFSAHRKEALAACREMMETLKSTAPFWKQD